jgi:tetratricopeptide (TPR) repeat protein
VHALQARVALQGEQYEQALKLLGEIKPGADPSVLEDALQWTVGAAFGLLNKAQPEAARAVFLRLQQQHPDRAIPPYGLARVALDTGVPAEAATLLARAAALKDADRLPIDYRLGMAQQALGQSELARASFQRYLKSSNAQGKSAEDAKKRLAQLTS